MVSKNEYNVLLAIWNAGRPLTAAEIVSSVEDKSFKERTIHSLLNSLLDKGLIYVDGQKLSSRIYSRCFNTSISFEEYHSDLIKKSALYRKDKGDVLSGVFAALIDENVNADTLDRLDALLEERKKRLQDGSDLL